LADNYSEEVIGLLAQLTYFEDPQNGGNLKVKRGEMEAKMKLM